jgi:hypothetical protein
VLSFKLEEGKLRPSPSRFAVQKINTYDVWAVNQFEVFTDKILFALSLRYGKQNGVVFNSKKQFNDTDWLADNGELTLWTVKAIPGYNAITNPFLIGVDDSGMKLVLVNTATRAMLDIAVLKKNHPDDQIMQGSI